MGLQLISQLLCESESAFKFALRSLLSVRQCEGVVQEEYLALPSHTLLVAAAIG